MDASGALSPAEDPLKQGLDGEQVQRGKALYMETCADCHGYQGESGYVFEGARLGLVEPIEEIATERNRLDSYTKDFREVQRDNLGFESFLKTDGYANHPLDGLWLRSPYLHNGSVPTLHDLLQPPEERPVAFLRGGDNEKTDLLTYLTTF